MENLGNAHVPDQRQAVLIHPAQFSRDLFKLSLKDLCEDEPRENQADVDSNDNLIATYWG